MEEEAPDPKMAEMRRKIMEIEKDTTLSADEKAVRRQQVMNPRCAAKGKAAAEETAGAHLVVQAVLLLSAHTLQRPSRLAAPRIRWPSWRMP